MTENSTTAGGKGPFERKGVVRVGLLMLAVITSSALVYRSLQHRTGTGRPSEPSTANGPGAGLDAGASGVSTAKFAFLSEADLVPVPPTGPVRGAGDAALRAAFAANGVAKKDYGLAPFSADRAPAQFDGQRWSWRKRVGMGRGDLEAEVSVSTGGAIERVTVKLLTYQFARDAL